MRIKENKVAAPWWIIKKRRENVEKYKSNDRYEWEGE